MNEQSPFIFDNSFKAELAGFYVCWKGDAAPSPSVLRLNEDLSEELGLAANTLKSPIAAQWLTGSKMPKGAASIAMAYAGDQFGNFTLQLGDGRALLVGELLDRDGARRDLQLKGSGRTPYSRGADGKAALGPVLREYLMGEAMHALGVPTTRALAVSLTGQEIMRKGYQKGAVLARVASSHLRVGTFQFFAANQEKEKVRRLSDYAIERHYPEIAGRKDRYLELFRRVRDAQAKLIAHWVSVGFVHGVMNTDNMTISGETIDYGPCAFIDSYDPEAVFSSIDEHGRYAYGKQPTIGQWNLRRFAESLLGLINLDAPDDEVQSLTNELNAFPLHYQVIWLELMRNKLGLRTTEEGDLLLANDLHGAMWGQNVDYTKLFRALSDVVRGDRSPARALFKEPEAHFDKWLDRYEARLDRESETVENITIGMDLVNPIYIPRNHLVEEALEAAEKGDMEPFDTLLNVLKAPFTEQPNAAKFAEPAPVDFGPYKTFCGT
jgi:uncharacterized protein YdiU (UPF0061 family)